MKINQFYNMQREMWMNSWKHGEKRERDETKE